MTTPAWTVALGDLHYLTTGSIAVSDLSFWYNIIAAAGVAGVWVIAFMFDWIVSKKVYDKAVSDGLEWKSLYEHERDAHSDTRNALALASQRAEAGIEAARVTKALVDGLRDKSSSTGA